MLYVSQCPGVMLEPRSAVGVQKNRKIQTTSRKPGKEGHTRVRVTKTAAGPGARATHMGHGRRRMPRAGAAEAMAKDTESGQEIHPLMQREPWGKKQEKGKSLKMVCSLLSRQRKGPRAAGRL